MPRTPPARLLLFPFAAFLVVLPLILNGCSCGHDFTFHLSSWLDAASQIRHGVLLPRWTISAAWNSGEPRFLFYPPLSWLLGALLTLATPGAAPILFTWIALTAAACTMYRLARDFTTSHIALLAAALYIVNPYMLFTAYERTAYGELLAAAWLPLLVAAALATRPAITAIAVPIALLWITNAPAAIIGCYAFAAIIAVRIALLFIQAQRRFHALRDATPPQPLNPLELFLRSLFGITLGAALAGFYLVPAAYERRFVQIEMAIIPNMRFQDNFLFGHTADEPHNIVLRTASLIALTMLALTVIPVGLLFFRTRKFTTAYIALATLTLIIAFCLTPLSTPIWNHLPELAFLQFPWRLLSLLGVVFALAVALLFNELATSSTLFMSWLHRAMSGVGTPLAVTALTLASSFLCIQLFRQPCELADLPGTHAQLFATGHGAAPTDEYTPTNADNDFLRTDNPGYWLADEPQAFAPNSTPNPAATIVNYDEPPPLDQTISTPVPRHLTLDLPAPQTLVLNLRDYPAWRITRNGELLDDHVQRDDGLIAVPLPVGHSTIDIFWHGTADQLLGLILTTLALLTLGTGSILSYRTHRTRTTA
jgi:hypothetical protein